jgi:hypothetical protein
MRKLTTLLATLVLGSTASLAVASPARSYDGWSSAPHTTVAGPRYAVAGPRYAAAGPRTVAARAATPYARPDGAYRIWNGRGTADDFGPRRYRSTWSALAAPFELGQFGQRAGGSDCIDVNDRGTFTQLRVQADAGRAFVDRVIVKFADGSDQQVHLDRALDGNNRRIAQIVVTGGGGALQVFAI